MSAQRPQDLVFTLFGEYLLDKDEVWVGSLISLLEPFGLSEGGVRTVLSRMARKGWLSSERLGRHSFYSLTPRGRRLLEEGQARIFRPTWDIEWDGTWFLLAYSIPQDSRKLRDRLRDRLAWLGFGSIGNGLWISPHDVTREITELSEDLGLMEHLVCFRAERVAGANDDELVRRCWDLAGLDRAYADFVSRWTATMESGEGRDVGSGLVRAEPRGAVQRIDPADLARRGFALRFQLIHEFRRFPLDDPFLPRPLLPTPWNGDAASRMFLSLHDRLVGPADAWVDRVLAEAPEPAGSPS